MMALLGALLVVVLFDEVYHAYRQNYATWE